MAVIHLVFEGFNLRLESKISRTTLMDYMVACYNARQGWIPKRDDFGKFIDLTD